MAKKVTFEGLPAAVEKVLEILSSPDNSQAALPEILRRLTAIEKRLDYLQRTLSVDRPAMDVQTVCRLLKIRPRIAYTLAENGTILSRTEGRKILFYEDDVHRYFVEMTRGTEPAPVDNGEDEAGQVPLKRRGRPPGSKNRKLPV